MAFHKHGEIELKVMCLIRHDGSILVSKGYDNAKKETFCRFLGGSLEFGETTEQGVRREIKEELGSDITDLQLVDVIQNVFKYEEEKRHQIVFLYKGGLLDESLYEKKAIHVVDATEFDAEWIPIEKILSGEIVLYPEHDYSDILR